MCGITGIINIDRIPVNRDLIKTMNDIIHYRGPDHYSFYFDDENGVGFGHRRLSIIDLSPSGNQPMSNEDKTIWITYNGEIYNYLELKEDLKAKGIPFKSKSDTEVILKAYEEWGDDCVRHFNGMWSFAVWDKNKKRLFCSRDRLGIKPFYYFYDGKVFVFASEIKQILMHPGYKSGVNMDALFDYLAFGRFNISEETFYENIYQLMGGNSLYLDLSGDNPRLNIIKYWDINLESKCNALTDQEYAEGFYNEFSRSVKLRLRSDVAVGSCLSGGLDSSSIVCVANKQMKESGKGYTQKAFSVCYENNAFDEREFIEEVKKVTDIESFCIFPQPDDLQKEIKDAIWHLDGPTINGSVYSQRRLFKAANEHGVKVMLDGQGGDEVLAGYHEYFWPYLLNLLSEFRFLKFFSEVCFLKKNHGYSIPSTIERLFRNSGLYTKNRCKYLKLLKKEFYNNRKKRSIASEFNQKRFCNERLKNTLYRLIKYTNIPQLLHYEDRNSMAFSVESRVPFLDYRLVEYAFSLPDDQKIRDGTTKYVLRKALSGILPEKIIQRQDKIGFVSPDIRWLTGPLKDYFFELLDSRAAKDLNIFHTEKVKRFFDNDKKRARYNLIFWRIIGAIVWYDNMINNYIPGIHSII
ncbi:asparagine synthase (glutamine-hydrolyzing) [bacterium]|nr:asparagine synthase (glutamine-hydrolyzing) [bacterium]